MSKKSTIILLGILVFLAPFTGFPSSWKFIFYIIAGLLVAILGSLMKGDNDQSVLNSISPAEHSNDQTFVENDIN